MPQRAAGWLSGLAHPRHGDPLGVALLGWLWLGSPFVVIALISHDQRLLGLIAAHQTRCLAAGWTGVAMMCLGVALMPTALGATMFWVGTPLAGLAVWRRRDEGDGPGGDDPDVPPVDWDEFERSFWAHVRRRGPMSRRPRSPSTR
jgi:hypothetical protein